MIDRDAVASNVGTEDPSWLSKDDLVARGEREVWLAVGCGYTAGLLSGFAIFALMAAL